MFALRRKLRGIGADLVVCETPSTGCWSIGAPRSGSLRCCVPLLLADAARGDDAIPRYVAQQGEDRGDCTLPVRPCRTIQYALSVAGKGDQVRVASGAYQIADVLDAFRLGGERRRRARGVRPLRSLSPTSARRKPNNVLTGVPAALRDQLQARGFQVVVDRKALDAAGRAAIAGFQATQTSTTRTDCVDNEAGAYPCEGIDLHAHMALLDLSSAPTSAADVWGFVDLNTEREYALLGVSRMDSWSIDVTDPTVAFRSEHGARRRYSGLAGRQGHAVATTRGSHRWQTYAYVSTEYGGRLVVVDLTELPNTVCVSVVDPMHIRAQRLREQCGLHDRCSSRRRPGTPPLLQVLGSAANRGAFRSFDTGDPLNLVRDCQVGGRLQPRCQFHVGLGTTGPPPAKRATGETCEVLLDFSEVRDRDLGLQRSITPRSY